MPRASAIIDDPDAGWNQGANRRPSLNDLAEEIWQICEEKGFHEPIDPTALLKGMHLMLIVTEVAEALDAMRNGEDESEEIADAVIRLLHYGSTHGVDVEGAVLGKIEKNKGRPYKHGKKF